MGGEVSPCVDDGVGFDRGVELVFLVTEILGCRTVKELRGWREVNTLYAHRSVTAVSLQRRPTWSPSRSTAVQRPLESRAATSLEGSPPVRNFRIISLRRKS